MMTSRAMMMKCENSGVLHIDGTYKLIKNRFPVMVLGITDIAGEFHPIAQCVTSHEKEGYTNTNSNIESFNRQINGFTQKKKLTIFGIVEKCCELVHYYSTEQAGRFNKYPKFSTKLNESALKIDKGLFKKSSSVLEIDSD